MIWVLAILVFFSVALVAVSIRLFMSPAEENARTATKRRYVQLKHDAVPAETHLEAILRVTTYSEIGFLDRFLSGTSQIANLQDLLDKAGNPINLGTLLLLSATLAMVGALVGAVMGLGWATLIPFFLLGALPYMAVSKIKQKRLDVFESQFPEAVELVARALRAGHGFSSGLRMVGEEMSEPVASEFVKTFEDYSFGKTMEEALHGLVQRVELEDVKFFASAVSLQRETGGNLTEILDNISYIIRERFRLQRTVKALSAEGRLSGWILSLMPPALLLMLWWVSPDYINMAMNHPIGQTMLVIGAAFEVLGIVVIKQIIKMKV